MLLHPIDFRRDIPRNIGHKAFNIETIAAKPAVQQGFFCAVPIMFGPRFSVNTNAGICIAEDGRTSFAADGQLFQPGEVSFTSDPEKVNAEIAAGDAGDDWYWPVTHAGFKIYGHWLIDIIPRVLLSRKLTGKRVICLLRGDTPTWAPGLLDMFGVEHRPMAEFEGKAIVLIATVRRHDWLADQAFSELRETTLAISSNLGAGSSPTPEKIYLTRKLWSNQSRAMTNHAEVEALFAGNGFEVVSPETLPLSEQVQLFANAKIIAGEAGSAMHNSVWAGEECRFLNLQSARQSHFIQSSLCKHFGQTLVNLWGETETQDWGSAFKVDVGLLERHIDQIADPNSEFWRSPS